MLVREIMTSPAVSIHADSDLDVAIELLAGRRVTALPVVADEDRLVGMLSEVDVLRRAVQPDMRTHLQRVTQEPAPLPKTVAEIMTTEIHATTENADVADLVKVFIRTSLKSLPVVHRDTLIGIISRSDIIRAFWRGDDELTADLRAAFFDYGQEGWSIDVEHGVVTITGTGSARERDIAAAIARSVLGVRRVRVSDQL